MAHRHLVAVGACAGGVEALRRPAGIPDFVGRLPVASGEGAAAGSDPP